MTEHHPLSQPQNRGGFIMINHQKYSTSKPKYHQVSQRHKFLLFRYVRTPNRLQQSREATDEHVQDLHPYDIHLFWADVRERVKQQVGSMASQEWRLMNIPTVGLAWSLMLGVRCFDHQMFVLAKSYCKILQMDVDGDRWFFKFSNLTPL